MTTGRLTCFKAYDVRGRLGHDLDANIAYRIGRGFARALGATRVVVGWDTRESSVELSEAVVAGLIDEGVEVLSLGLCGTEEMYFAVSHFDASGGIEITASHNPIDYNGLKMVRQGSAPLDSATGLSRIHKLAEADEFGAAHPGGSQRDVSSEARTAYVERVMQFVDVSRLRPLKILVNAGNGAAGPTFDAIAHALSGAGAPLEFVRLHHEPDPCFPNGIPNPLLPENQPATSQAVIDSGADLGVAWDGDFDRCFFFDETGQFIEGEYIVGLLAEVFLAREPGARIVYDPRVVWNTRDIIEGAAGQAIQSRTGHAFVKEAMRAQQAVYGGEMSAHHYFRDFVYCDSGMIPWLVMIELLCHTGHPISALVAERRAGFPSSGEINFVVADPATVRARIDAAYGPSAVSRDEIDGLSLDMGDWRFNLRASNTEPVLRLNAEARGNRTMLDREVAKLVKMIQVDCASL